MRVTSCLRVLWPAGAALGLCACIPQVAPPEGWDRPRSPATPAAAAPRPHGHPRPADPGEQPESDVEAGGSPRAIDLPPSQSAEVPRQPAPAWVARKVVPDAKTIPDGSYTAQAGDTLRSIGNKTGVGSDALARANKLEPGTPITAGQRLRVPGGRYHTVKEGDTGVGIAQAYGVPWSQVATLNDLQPPYVLRSGQKLALPSAAEVAHLSVDDRAKAFQLDIDDLITGSAPAIAPKAAPAKPTTSPAKPAPASKPVAAPAQFAGKFDWPLTGKIIQPFGTGSGGRRNDGINIAADKGDPIRAAADGVVAYAGSDIAVYGGLILINHGEGWITAYGHAQQILVTRGQAVKKGDVIARAGATGQVNAPQLHFEIRNKRTPVDPLRYLPPRS